MFGRILGVGLVFFACSQTVQAALVASLSLEYELVEDGRTRYDYTLTNALESEFLLDTFLLDTGAGIDMEIAAPEGWIVDYAPEEETFELAFQSEAADALAPGESAVFTLFAAASPEQLPYFLANIARSDEEGGYVFDYILSPWRRYGIRLGDTNDDGVVDLIDLNNVRNNFGATGDPVLGDTDPFDGKVSLYDLNQVRNNFGRTYPTPVPEPGTMLLAIIGAASLVVRRYADLSSSAS